MRRPARPAAPSARPACQTRSAARFFLPPSARAPRAESPRRGRLPPPAAHRRGSNTHTTERTPSRCPDAPQAAPESPRPPAARSPPVPRSADRWAESAHRADACQTARAAPDTRPLRGCRASVWPPQTARASRKKTPRRAPASFFPKYPAPRRAKTIRSSRFFPFPPSARHSAHRAAPPRSASRPPA